MTTAQAMQYIADSNSGKITWDDNGRAAANNVLNAGGGGSAETINLKDLGASNTEFAKNLNSMEDTALDSFITKQQSQDSPLAVYTKFNEQLGIPELLKTQSTLQSQIGTLEDSIRRVKGNVAATTRNSMVTEGQRAGLVEARQQPLQENLSYTATAAGRIGNQISEARNLLGTMTQLVMQGQDRELEPFRMKLEMVSNQAARLMTGFTADRQEQLSVLMDKLQRQRQLDDREWELANQLAEEERAFERSKEGFLFEQANALPNTEIVTVDGRKKLINKQNGQTVADLGASDSGASVDSWVQDYLSLLGGQNKKTGWTVVGSGDSGFSQYDPSVLNDVVFDNQDVGF